MTTFPSAKNILKQYWGYGDFRLNQEKIIETVFQGKDVLAIMPTGGGKSLCYQVPALGFEGVCIVISPLIALMKDQVDQLNKRGILADAIFSGLTKDEIDYTLDNAVYGNTKFLYVSPERLETDIFRERVKKMKVSLVAVDEAHCISQWGYDFRPSYMNISKLREALPGVPFIALTASATPDVRIDIIKQLGLDAEVFTSSFARANISFVCRKVESKTAKLNEILGSLGGSGIIYVRSRKNAAQVAAHLQQSGIGAACYHAGLDAEERSKRQEQWMKGTTAIMVCTNAFGMGIDKAAVRFVIHWDVPDSLEAYYQEAGRAGRDGKMSYAVLLYRPADIGRLKSDLKRQFPELAEIRNVYNALCNYLQVSLHSGYMMSFDFDLLRFAKTYKLDMVKAWNIIRILEKEGYLLTSDSVKMPSRLKFTMSKPDLYRFQVENEKWDRIIQALLRTYGGILDHYTPINEGYLADRLAATPVQLSRDLKTLTKKGVLNYIPFKQNPTITILKDRLPDRSVIINREFWKTRKEVAEKKLEAMLAYCTLDTRCRQQIISAYFGAETEEPCGKCDHCVEEKSRGKDADAEFRKIKSYILERLSGHDMLEVDSIEKELGFYGRKKCTSAIRRLVDEGILQINGNRMISMRR